MDTLTTVTLIFTDLTNAATFLLDPRPGGGGRLRSLSAALAFAGSFAAICFGFYLAGFDGAEMAIRRGGVGRGGGVCGVGSGAEVVADSGSGSGGIAGRGSEIVEAVVCG